MPVKLMSTFVQMQIEHWDFLPFLFIYFLFKFKQVFYFSCRT